MDGLETLVTDVLIHAGVAKLDVKSRSGVELPGYYRPEKKRDLIVAPRGQLVAAIEFKSMVGSFGNNFNNRVEEAVGNAADLWVAFREGRLGTISAPFLGYVLLLQDHPDVHRPHRGFREPLCAVDPVFRETSYAQRSEVLCRRLVLERLYTSACLMLSTESCPVRQPARDLSFQRFTTALWGHVAAFLETQ